MRNLGTARRSDVPEGASDEEGIWDFERMLKADKVSTSDVAGRWEWYSESVRKGSWLCPRQLSKSLRQLGRTLKRSAKMRQWPTDDLT